MMRYFAIIVLILIGECASAGQLRVGSKERLISLTAAIATAHRGDTILVAPGIYREGRIQIDKPLTLLGLEYPVIDGESKYENVAVRADSVTFSGFRVCNSGVSSLDDIAGLKIYGHTHVTIAGNRFDNCFFGVYAQKSTNCVIKDNVLTAHKTQEQQSGNGIHCWKCDSMQITANHLSGHRDGIYFEFVTRSLIWRNVSERNLRYGLHFMFSNSDTYAANVFEHNGAGVSVMFSNHVTMLHNWFRDNQGDAAYGILLKEISDSYIDGNYFVGNTSGILIEGASRVPVIHNSFERNGWALRIQASCQEVDLKGNDFTGNTYDVGTNGSLVLNTFDRNYWDKYEGYDLNKNGIGDVPYHPVSLFGMISEKYPVAMMFFHSLAAALIDRTERVLPSLTPDMLKDDHPLMKPLKL
jgi:nitrous oxidase accessory protein